MIPTITSKVTNDTRKSITSIPDIDESNIISLLKCPTECPDITPETLIQEIVLEKRSLKPSAHWAVYVPYRTGTHYVKVDLRSDTYLLLYHATLPKLTDSIRMYNLKLDHPVPLSFIYSAAYELAKKHGEWKGGDVYNCQDFAIMLMEKLNIEGKMLNRFKGERTLAKDIYLWCANVRAQFKTKDNYTKSIDSEADARYAEHERLRF